MIPKPGEYGERWEMPTGPFAGEAPWYWSSRGSQKERAIDCVNALDGCDPDKLAGLIKAARKVVEQLSNDDPAELCASIESLEISIDAFTERKE